MQEDVFEPVEVVVKLICLKKIRESRLQIGYSICRAALYARRCGDSVRFIQGLAILADGMNRELPVAMRHIELCEVVRSADGVQLLRDVGYENPVFLRKIVYWA